MLIQLGLVVPEHPSWTLLLTAAISLGCALVFFRRDSSIFDGAARSLSWSKWTPLGRTGGTIAYDDITGVTVETMSGSETVPSARVVVHTATDTVPLTAHYSASPDRWEPAAIRIRQLVGLGATDLTEDSLRAMVAQGRKIDAIRHLRLKTGMSLADARHAVERWFRGAHKH